MAHAYHPIIYQGWGQVLESSTSDFHIYKYKLKVLEWHQVHHVVFQSSTSTKNFGGKTCGWFKV